MAGFSPTTGIAQQILERERTRIPAEARARGARGAFQPKGITRRILERRTPTLRRRKRPPQGAGLGAIPAPTPTTPPTKPPTPPPEADLVATRSRRRSQKRFAIAAKGQGAGAMATAPRQTTSAGLLSTIGGIAGGLIGGPAGASIGAGLGSAIEGRGRQRGAGRSLVAQGPCLPGERRIGNTCVDFGAALPGGDPLSRPATGTVIEAGGQTVEGSFGIPARVPVVELREHRDCGPGMVLGKDDLCYPRAVLSRRSQFRKWRQPARPPISRRDMNAIRSLERVQAAVKRLNKAAGFKAPKRK